MSDGCGPGGIITSRVDEANVVTPYREIVAEAAAELADALGESLLALYVYGSVATGMARPPASDVDLVAVVASGTDTAAVGAAARRLSARHAATVREVAIGTVTPESLQAADEEGFAGRCFLRHYCALVTGIDFRPEFEPCRATPRLALAFAGDVDAHVRRLLARLDADGAGPTAAPAARRLLLAAAPLVSVLAGTWTTSRTAAVRLIGVHHPDRAAEAAELARWLGGEHPSTDVRAVVESFGTWLAGPVVRAVAALGE